MMLLIIAVAAFLLFRRMSRVGEGATPRPGPGDGPGWKPLAARLKQRLGVRAAVVAALGCGAVVAGGLMWGLWGLVGGTLVLAAGLAWVVARTTEVRLRPRRIRRSRSGKLTEEERDAFEQIVANLTADD